jgi:chorismate-pyruvate lyase
MPGFGRRAAGCDSMVGVTTPSGLETALSRASGTVTAFLERLVGEPIDARQRSHAMTRADAPSALQVAEGHPLLLRAAVLQGRTSGRSFLYAESVLVPSRLPGRFRRRLESGSDPIGRILGEEGITVTREPLAASDRGSVSVSSQTGLAIGDYLLVRTYRVDSEGNPLMVITEWFLPSLEWFLPLR